MAAVTALKENVFRDVRSLRMALASQSRGTGIGAPPGVIWDD
jgi:hypothetical protein